jgi:hypothetical protein
MRTINDPEKRSLAPTQTVPLSVKHFTPMYRFTIRELVLLTLVVAMGVGWWIDRTRLWYHSNQMEFVAENLLLEIEHVTGKPYSVKLSDGSAWPKGREKGSGLLNN